MTHTISVLSLLLFSILMLPSFSHAQQIEMSSTLNPVGSGARATGMGGAFIGVADDATAASWNPAGLVQLEKPEVSMVYSYFYRTQSYSSSIHPEVDSRNAMDTSGINYGSAAYPFVLFGRNVVVSVNYQRLYEMNKSVDFRYTWNLSKGVINDAVSFEQRGFLYALAPAVAVQITPEVSVGATVNFWGSYLGKNGWSNDYTSNGTGNLNRLRVNETVLWKNSYSFRGINANFGVLWNVYGPLTIGAVVKTPFDAKINKTTSYTYDLIFPDLDPRFNVHQHIESSEQQTMKMPASYGIGLAYRHSDALTLALDVYRTEWSQFVIVNAKGEEMNPLDNRPISEGRLSDSTQVRLGGEYLFIREKDVIPVRAGLFYDPEPQKGTLDDYFGFSVGTGYSRGSVSCDVSYQYRFGRNLRGDLTAIEGVKTNVGQHTVMASVIYYF